jgi:hypothetical protein
MRRAPLPECYTRGCTNIARSDRRPGKDSSGLCQKCQWRQRHGYSLEDSTATLRNYRKTEGCMVPGCDEPFHAGKGAEKHWCQKHYSRWYRVTYEGQQKGADLVFGDRFKGGNK